MSSLTDAVPVLYLAWLNIISNLDIVVFILPYIILSVISVAIYRHYRHQYRHSWRLERIRWPLPRRWMVITMVKTCLYQIEWPLRPPQPALPVELWEKILDIATDPPLLFDTHTDPDKFYRLILNQTSNSNDHYFQSKHASKQLRMVCRLWNLIIISRFPQKWVMRRPALDHRSIPNWVRRISFTADDSSVDPNLLLEQTEPIDLPFVPIISFSPTWLGYIEHSVIEKMECLACPYTLIFDGNIRYISPRILQAIERTFSNLTTLFLPPREIDGTLSLPHLEVLYVARMVDVSSWWFPSLRHFAVGMAYVSYQHDPIWPYPIPGPLNKLQSLLLPAGHGHLQADANFWRTHPSLHLLGIDSEEFDVVDKPPPNHPFSHLLYVDGQSAISNHHSLQAFLNTNHLQRLPNLRAITIPIDISRATSYGLEALLSIQLTQWRRRVTWLDIEGNEIRFRQLRKKVKLRNWEWVIYNITGFRIQILPEPFRTIFPWYFYIYLMYLMWAIWFLVL